MSRCTAPPLTTTTPRLPIGRHRMVYMVCTCPSCARAFMPVPVMRPCLHARACMQGLGAHPGPDLGRSHKGDAGQCNRRVHSRRQGARRAARHPAAGAAGGRSGGSRQRRQRRRSTQLMMMAMGKRAVRCHPRTNAPCVLSSRLRLRPRRCVGTQPKQGDGLALGLHACRGLGPTCACLP